MTVDLPNNTYLQWTVSKDGVSGSNGDPNDNLQPNYIVRCRRHTVMDALKSKYYDTPSPMRDPMLDPIVEIYRMYFVTRWIIRKFSDEKLVLHKLAE